MGFQNQPNTVPPFSSKPEQYASRQQPWQHLFDSFDQSSQSTTYTNN
nr:hypothetical protein Iba_chr03aCG5790 [Ipomoea batatas]GMD03895.1 hypothetical protein Iba_chr06aCG13270 [Ipomoea batatas]